MELCSIGQDCFVFRVKLIYEKDLKTKNEQSKSVQGKL